MGLMKSIFVLLFTFFLTSSVLAEDDIDTSTPLSINPEQTPGSSPESVERVDFWSIISGQLLENRTETIKYGNTLIKNDINENRLVTEIIQSSKEIEDDLNYFTVIMAAYRQMEAEPDREILRKILDYIKTLMLEKIQHEKSFLKKRLPLAKNDNTRIVGQVLLEKFDELEKYLELLDQ